MIERGREWGGPRRCGGGWEGAGVDPTIVEVVRHQGGRGGGTNVWRGPDDGQEAVGEASVWTQWWWRRRNVEACAWRGPGGGRGSG
jgi:hypothetical protein